MKGISLRHGERGFGLVEAVVSVFILGLMVTSFTVALSTGASGAAEIDRQAVARTIAVSQLEYVKSLPYVAGSGAYPPIPVPQGWTVTAIRSPIPEAYGNTDVQKITVTVSYGGSVVLTVEDYKVNR